MRNLHFFKTGSIVSLLFTVLMLFNIGALELVSQDTVRLETRVAASDDRMSIKDICEINGEWIFGYNDGRISAKDQITGRDTWEVRLPLSRQVQTLLSDTVSGAIVALCSDGTLFIVDSLHRMEQVATGDMSVDAIAHGTGIMYALSSIGLYQVDIGNNGLTPVTVQGGIQNIISLRVASNGDLYIATSLSTMYTLRKQDQDGYIKMDSVFIQAGAVGDFILLKNGYLVKGASEKLYLVTREGKAALWIPPEVLEHYSNPNFVNITCRDIYTNIQSTRILFKSWSFTGQGPIVGFIADYSIENDSFEVVKQFEKEGTYNGSSYAYTDSAEAIGGHYGYNNCNYKGQEVSSTHRHPSSGSDWSSIRLQNNMIYAAVDNADSSLTTAFSADGFT